MRIVFLERTNIRTGPAISSPILRVAIPGEVAVTVLTSPTLSGGYEWWKIQFSNGISGCCARLVGVQQHLFRFAPLDFEQAADFTLSWEGEYVNNPQDPGGETNFGISKRSYPLLDIKALTIDQAKAIYFQDYWLAGRCAEFGHPKSIILFDIGVIGGIERITLLSSLTCLEIIARQFDFYTGLTTFSTFGKGWVRRNTALLRLLGAE